MRNLAETSNFILNYDQLYSLIENMYNSNDPLNISREYTDDTEVLLQNLKTLYELTKNRSAPIRLTKAINKIEDQLEAEENDEAHEDEQESPQPRHQNE